MSLHATTTDAPLRRPRRSAAIEVSGIRVTHAERVIDPAGGATKLDLVRYYDAVAAAMLPHLVGRNCSLVRAPDGIDGERFFQKHLGKLRIADIRELDPALMPPHEPLLEVPSKAALLAAAQMNTVEFHTGNSRVRNFGKPDRLVFDLDPGEGVEWAQVREGAILVRSLLEQLGLGSFLKTSGSKGLHVVVPIAGRWAFDAVKDFCHAVVQHLARTLPDRFVDKSGPANRVGRIFVDYLRNGFGATTVAAYSARARPGLPVSMPIAWEQLDRIDGSAAWTIASAPAWLAQRRSDPWAAYPECRQSLSAALGTLGRPRGLAARRR